MTLPIDKLIPDILEIVRRGRHLVIEAPPGAGKTTRVPRALLEVIEGDILVLEPRRLAARMAARRVSAELGEKPGETVGYQVRFEEIAGPRTRLRFLTEGVLTRRMLDDRNLRGVGLVVLDEFHERHLESDFALALLRRIDLPLIVMSATLEAAPVAAYLGGCPILHSEGRLFDLQIEYTPHSAAPLEEQVARALERLLGDGLTGDVLVFLPGAAEIRRAMQACQRIAGGAGALALPLYGDLPPAEQDRAVAPADRRKVIFSTNVAESSITIEGVTAVIDSGLARVAADSPWTGLPSLNVTRISKASAIQRAGRAARTAPGRVIRLYSADDFHRRRDHDPPEIRRRELSQIALAMRAMRIDYLDWLEAPPEGAWNAALALLDLLGATDDMARLPVHPRLAKLILEAGEAGCRASAELSAGGHDVERVYRQLRRLAPRRPRSTANDLSRAYFAAFPDRVARRRRRDEVALSSGGSAVFPGCPHEFFVALDIEERRERGLPLIRSAWPIEPEWLLDRAVERTTLEWNSTAERVDEVRSLLYDQLVIEETCGKPVDLQGASRILAAKAMEAGIEHFVDREEWERLQARIAFAKDRGAASFGDPEHLLEQACQGLTSFAELRLLDLLRAVRAKIPRLDEIAPERLRLPGGRQVKIQYAPGRAPWIASRLQDFFGVKETPVVAGVPVVVHLLAPNQRPVQMTRDLAGFWTRLYPQVRRELSRRYPKHAWPENPQR